MSDLELNDNVVRIPIKLLIGRLNVRKKTGNIDTLKSSIEALGILQTLVVRQEETKKFAVIVGSRRYTAAKEIGIKQHPCIIRKMDDAEAPLESVSEIPHKRFLSLGCVF